jgi:ElaB/YqjD/DUF883 family membrane-anchored ribosome-binding protein
MRRTAASPPALQALPISIPVPQPIESEPTMSNSNLNIGTQISDGATSMLDATTHAADQALNGLTREAQNLAQRSSQLLHDGSAQVRKQAEAARDATRGYIQHDPLKAVLIAAAAGASLVLLGSLLTRSPRNQR